MEQPIGLTKDQLRELTGYLHNKNQCDALILMGIAFRVRPDGSPFVPLSAIEPGTKSLDKVHEPVLTQI